MPKRGFWKTYFWLAPTLLFLDWLLLAARFHFPALKSDILFQILNFPSGGLFLWLGIKTNPWWYSLFGQKFELILNDEMGTGFAFLLVVAFQAGCCTALLRILRQTVLPIKRVS